MCCPIPTQPGHPAVRPYLSKIFSRKWNLFARLPLANSSFCWIVGPCCVLLAVAFHGLPTHRFKNCKYQALSQSRRLTQRVIFAPVGVGEVKLPVKNLLASTSFSSSQAHFSYWHNFPSVVLAQDRTIRRSPSSLHLKIVHNPCTVSYHPSSPSACDPVQLLSCISLRRLLEMPEAVPELRNSLVLHAPSSLSSLLALQSQSDLWIDTG